MLYIIWYALRVIYKIFMLIASVFCYVIINILALVMLFEIMPLKFRYLSIDSGYYNDFIYFCKSDRKYKTKTIQP